MKDPNEFARCHALNAIDCIEAKTAELITGVVNMLQELPEFTRRNYDVRSAKRLIDKWGVNEDDYEIDFDW